MAPASRKTWSTNALKSIARPEALVSGSFFQGKLKRDLFRLFGLVRQCDIQICLYAARSPSSELLTVMNGRLNDMPPRDPLLRASDLTVS